MDRTFSKTLNSIRKSVERAWSSSRESGGSFEDAAESAFAASVKRLQRNPSQNEARIQFMEDVVFLALNYKSASMQEHRKTVSYFNFENISIEADEINSEGSHRQIDANQHLIVPDDFNTDNKKHEAVSRAWNLRWNEYLNASPFLTWNKFLMEHCTNPMPVGLAWFSAPNHVSRREDDSIGDYIQVGTGLDKNGQRRLCINHSLTEFTKLSESWQPEVELKKELRSRWSNCQPLASTPRKHWSSLQALEFAYKSLFWGFGIWGGGAFISIPIKYGSKAPDGTGVISICTRKPLRQSEVNMWTLIAQTTIGTVLELEAEARITRATSKSTHRLGHLFAGKSSNISTSLINARKPILIALDQIQEGSEHSILELLQDANRRLDDLRRLSAGYSFFGKLVNLVAVAENAYSLVEIRKSDHGEKWLASEAPNFLLAVNQAAELTAHPDNHNVHIRTVLTGECDQDDFRIPSTDGIYPNNELLLLILFELSSNVIKFGKAIDGAIMWTVDLQRDGVGKQILTLSNIISEVASDLPVDRSPSSEHGFGGEALVARLLGLFSPSINFSSTIGSLGTESTYTYRFEARR